MAVCAVRYQEICTATSPNLVGSFSASAALHVAHGGVQTPRSSKGVFTVRRPNISGHGRTIRLVGASSLDTGYTAGRLMIVEFNQVEILRQNPIG